MEKCVAVHEETIYYYDGIILARVAVERDAGAATGLAIALPDDYFLISVPGDHVVSAVLAGREELRTAFAGCSEVYLVPDIPAWGGEPLHGIRHREPLPEEWLSAPGSFVTNATGGPPV